MTTCPGTILVAEDSTVVRAVTVAHLEAAGYAAVEAADGHAALALAESAAPDVMLLDIEMPGLDGYQVLAQLRLDEVGSRLPVIFLTARSTPDEVAAALDAGAQDFLTKPFNSAELLARVRAAVRVKRLEDELRRRNAELHRLARIDALTGLHNRRHLDEQLFALAKGAVRRGHPLGVLLLDLDHFKEINDTRGHAAGDVVLRTVALRIAGTLRGEDVVGRWGGEEFLILLPTTECEGARQLGERVLAEIAREAVPLADGGSVCVTASIGCAAGVPRDPEALVRAADGALYAAKACGRARLEVAPDG